MKRPFKGSSSGSKSFKGSSPRPKRRRTNLLGREQNQCRFCREGCRFIDYKDVDMLGKLLTNRGKIFSRKRSGNCAKCQRKVMRAIKRARFMGLLPYTA
ncbi:MAG: 30S ribosomal protein S18 [Planctomycetota bacterium]